MGFQKFLWQFVTCSYKKIFSKNLYKNMRMLICSFPSSSRHFRNRTYFANKKIKKIKMFLYVETICKQICKPLPFLWKFLSCWKMRPPCFLICQIWIPYAGGGGEDYGAENENENWSQQTTGIKHRSSNTLADNLEEKKTPDSESKGKECITLYEAKEINE